MTDKTYKNESVCPECLTPHCKHCKCPKCDSVVLETYKEKEREEMSLEEADFVLRWGATRTDDEVKMRDNVWHWHIESQKRLLERVEKEVICDNNRVIDMDSSESISTSVFVVKETFSKQRSKLQSLLKELEEKNER